jgi:hypothetical protein
MFALVERSPKPATLADRECESCRCVITLLKEERFWPFSFWAIATASTILSCQEHTRTRKFSKIRKIGTYIFIVSEK